MKRMMSTRFQAVIAVTVAATAHANVIYVRANAVGANNGTSWTDAYQSLQPALVVSQVGDEIRVAQGIYKPATPGGARTVSFELRSGLAVLGGFAGTGADPDARDPELYVTILSGDINGTNVNNSYHVVTAIDVDDTTRIDGFTISGGRSNGGTPNDRGAGLRLVNSSASIRACVITGNTSGRAAGIYIEGGAPSVADCSIRQNTSLRYGGGAYLLNSNAVFENCHVSENFTGLTDGLIVGLGGGIYCEQGSPIFRDCNIELNQSTVSGGGVASLQCTPTFVACRISQNRDGTVADGNGGGILISTSSHALLADCQVQNNLGSNTGGGISVESQSSVSISNCEISANRCARGGIGGGGINCQNSAASLRACTITGNYANAPASPPATENGGAGGGVLCDGLGASVEIQNCVIEGNFAGNGLFGGGPGGNGGGLVARNSALAVLVNCTLRGNRAGSGGWGISTWGGPGGSGGGVFMESGASAQIHGCVFHDNHAGSGGNGDRGAGQGGNGGALNFSGATCQLTNCTLARNDAGHGSTGGAGGASMGSVSYSNCVIWSNTPDQLSGGATVRYSDVQDGFAGVGNISGDPLFADSAQDDFRLAPFSPCIDAGENAGVPHDSLDLDGDGDVTEPTPLDRDGNPRFHDDAGTPDTGTGMPPVVDMGSYEFGLTSGCPGDLDGDRDIDLADLSLLLAEFGLSGPDLPADLDGDGDVDLADLTIVLSNFGQPCS